MANKRRRWTLRIVLGVALVGLLLGIPAWQVAEMAARYGAKIAGSAWHVVGRDGADALARDDLMAVDWLPGFSVRHVGPRTEVDVLWGAASGAARHRPGLGVTLEGEAGVGPEVVLAPPERGDPWPMGELAEEAGEALDVVIAAAFREPGPTPSLRTRAVLVAWRGDIVAERYGDGFDATVPQLGWSMTKSVAHALVGCAVQRGLLPGGMTALDQPLAWPDWTAGDPRLAITWNHALHMATGLEFGEVYNLPWGDAANMLFFADDVAGFAAGKDLAHEPGTVWAYSSGTTNLLCGALQRLVIQGANPQASRATLGEGGPSAGTSRATAAVSFARDALFSPLGMGSAVLEVDRSLTWIGSSFLYATPRDWLRFGQLYVQDGMWNGERVLPEGWAEHARSPAPGEGAPLYGAHWWLDRPRADGTPRQMPSCPDDVFMALGHNGQVLAVVPSRQLVVLRMGWSDDSSLVDLEGLVGGIAQALPE